MENVAFEYLKPGASESMSLEALEKAFADVLACPVCQA